MVNRPILSFLLLGAYGSLLPQALLAVIYFPATGRSARFGELLLLAGATGAATVLISAIWPTLVLEWRRARRWQRRLSARSAGTACGRALAFRVVGDEGIVTMPSYHTVQAVLFTYAFRHTGLVGYGIATLNMVMLLSIPPIGGHYLVDVLAGGALALGAIAVQRALRHGVMPVLKFKSEIFRRWQCQLFETARMVPDAPTAGSVDDVRIVSHN